MPVIDTLKYRIARIFQLYVWIGVPILVVAAVMPLGPWSFAAFVTFGIGAFAGIPIMHLRCSRCDKALFYDPASKTYMGPDINLFRRISPVCRKCGAVRASVA